MEEGKDVTVEVEWDESRIDIIGQNGNNGEHYEAEEESEVRGGAEA